MEKMNVEVRMYFWTANITKFNCAVPFTANTCTISDGVSIDCTK